MSWAGFSTARSPYDPAIVSLKFLYLLANIHATLRFYVCHGVVVGVQGTVNPPVTLPNHIVFAFHQFLIAVVEHDAYFSLPGRALALFRSNYGPNERDLLFVRWCSGFRKTSKLCDRDNGVFNRIPPKVPPRVLQAM